MPSEDKEHEGALPVSGSSANPASLNLGLYSFLAITPRQHANRYLLAVDAAVRSGHPLPEFHWNVWAPQMGIPGLGRLWTKRFMAYFGEELELLGYHVQRVTKDEPREVIIHARHVM